MIPPTQCSSLFQDSSLNKTPRDNCYIFGYEGPNAILQYVLDREWTLISVVNFLDTYGETMTHGSLYNFAILNNLITGHLGKMIITPNW